MKLKRTLAVTAMILLPLVAACTPHQIEVFKTLNPEQQQAVLDHYSKKHQASQSSGDCYSAIDKHWGGDKGWARKIVKRESGNNPKAQNSRSSAAGCAQLLKIHAPRFRKLGYSWADRYNADVNVKVAWDLYKEAGKSPWRLTSY